MTFTETAVAALLAIGAGGFSMTACGLLLSRNIYDRIHFLAPGTVLGGVAIPAAVLLQEGWSQAGVKAILIALLLFLSGPVLSHATARAVLIQERRREEDDAGHGRAAGTPAAGENR